RALRHLIDHSWIHLNVEWRDLTTEQWGHHVQTFQGRDIEARETPWMRAKEVWCHAVDLSPAGSYRDFPPDVLAGIGRDVLGSWERRGETPDVTLRLQDGPAGVGAAPDSDTVIVGRGGPVVSGTRADIVRWLAGRGARRLATGGVGALPELPRWF
ncbi:MAG: hypothetical protein LBM66_00230, partial [Bifidobacteriaceae bacterium]|nr:hypothetical protein [Bifidobacteriaceae bacterium]